MSTEEEKPIQQDHGTSAADSHKPNSEDPWRYVCPDCGSVNVRRLIHPSKRIGPLPQGGQGKKEALERRSMKYTCQSCSTRHKSLRDKKTGGLSKP